MTLPWMNKIREFQKAGYSDSDVLRKLCTYGLSEEKRINKAFETGDKE